MKNGPLFPLFHLPECNVFQISNWGRILIPTSLFVNRFYKILKIVCCPYQLVGSRSSDSIWLSVDSCSTVSYCDTALRLRTNIRWHIWVCEIGCPRIGCFKKIGWSSSHGMCYGKMSPQNDFQNYRPITEIEQSLFIFNGNFNGKMARFWISWRKMTQIWSIWF